VKKVLHLRIWRALAVFRSHYQKIDLEALSEGYVDIPEEELNTINVEVMETVRTLSTKFEEEIVPLAL
jgi:hypothetical protein